MRFAVVRSLFHGDVTSALLAGAIRGFADGGVSSHEIEVFEAPGSFELPLCALWLAESGGYDAIVCLGCVVRGETAHFEHVAGAAARGIARVSLETRLPVIFGVLTTETIQQAWQRAADVARGPSQHRSEKAVGNKGYEAAQSALQMARLRADIMAASRPTR